MVVAAQGHGVLDAEIVQFDERVFGFVASEALAEQVGQRGNPPQEAKLASDLMVLQPYCITGVS